MLWNFKQLISINCVFWHILRYSSKIRPGPYVFLCFIFMRMPLGLIVESYKNIQKLLDVEKKIFSLVFLLKIVKLHFCDYLRNKARSPTLNFAFCNLHE